MGGGGGGKGGGGYRMGAVFRRIESCVEHNNTAYRTIIQQPEAIITGSPNWQTAITAWKLKQRSSQQKDVQKSCHQHENFKYLLNDNMFIKICLTCTRTAWKFQWFSQRKAQPTYIMPACLPRPPFLPLIERNVLSVHNYVIFLDLTFLCWRRRIHVCECVDGKPGEKHMFRIL